MRVRRDSTSCVTSLIIFALSFGESVVNHFARRCCWKKEKARSLGQTSSFTIEVGDGGN